MESTRLEDELAVSRRARPADGVVVSPSHPSFSASPVPEAKGEQDEEMSGMSPSEGYSKENAEIDELCCGSFVTCALLRPT